MRPVHCFCAIGTTLFFVYLGLFLKQMIINVIFEEKKVGRGIFSKEEGKGNHDNTDPMPTSN